MAQRHSVSSAVTGGTTSYFNAYKNSLFAEVERQKNSNTKCFVNRVIYVAARPKHAIDGNWATIAEYYEKLLAKFQKSTQEGVTGILLIYPKCVIHMLEATTEIVTRILKDLILLQNTDSHLFDAKILIMSYKIRSRIFPLWGYRFLTPPLSLQDVSTQPIESLVPDCLAMIYKLCVCFLKRKAGSTGKDPQEQSLVLEEGTVLYLCQSPALHSPSTFLQTYTAPPNMLMDSEIVWPTQSRLYW